MSGKGGEKPTACSQLTPGPRTGKLLRGVPGSERGPWLEPRSGGARRALEEDLVWAVLGLKWDKKMKPKKLIRDDSCSDKPIFLGRTDLIRVCHVMISVPEHITNES